jgi:hypothetical protein
MISLNLSEKVPLDKFFLQKAVKFYPNSELSNEQYAVKVINKAQLKKKPFLQKYIDQ